MIFVFHASPPRRCVPLRQPGSAFMVLHKTHATEPLMSFLPAIDYMQNQCVRQYVSIGLRETNGFPRSPRNSAYVACRARPPNATVTLCHGMPISKEAGIQFLCMEARQVHVTHPTFSLPPRPRRAVIPAHARFHG